MNDLWNAGDTWTLEAFAEVDGPWTNEGLVTMDTVVHFVLAQVPGGYLLKCGRPWRCDKDICYPLIQLANPGPFRTRQDARDAAVVQATQRLLSGEWTAR